MKFMNYFFITGSSTGIGKALTDLLLSNKKNFVYGISRSNGIHDSHYKHIQFDLTDTEKVRKFKFPDFEDAESVTLVNNAIFHSEIRHFEDTTQDDIAGTYGVNIISPALLMNSFIRKYQDFKYRRVVINISSGAAKRPIESWGNYCASKAALLMLGNVIDIEQKMKKQEERIRIFSFSPGVVDTKAQERIRSASQENFSDVKRFIDYKEKNQLAKPEDIAKKIQHIIANAGTIEKYDLNAGEFS